MNFQSKYTHVTSIQIKKQSITSSGNLSHINTFPPALL